MRRGAWILNNKYKTYRCLNKDCSHFKKKKWAFPLFKGIVEGKSYVVVKCRFCNVDRAVNVLKEQPEIKKVDDKPEDVLNFLRAKRANPA